MSSPTYNAVVEFLAMTSRPAIAHRVMCCSLHFKHGKSLIRHTTSRMLNFSRARTSSSRWKLWGWEVTAAADLTELIHIKSAAANLLNDAGRRRRHRFPSENQRKPGRKGNSQHGQTDQNHVFKSNNQQFNVQFERSNTHHGHFEFTTSHFHAFDSCLTLVHVFITRWL